MIKFDSLEAAERAKQSLNGCDIYSGCCTLKIEFAKVKYGVNTVICIFNLCFNAIYSKVIISFQPTRLNVYKNDNESWDYTNNALGIHY